MNRDERIRRPTPDRRQPIRGGWLSLFGPPEPRATGDDSDGDGAGNGAGDAISRAVDLGYRVVDEYIRQGQNAARLIARRSYGPQAMANDMQEVAARVVQYGAEFMDVWVNLLGQAAAAPPGRSGARQAGADGDALRPRGGEPSKQARGARIALQVDSARPTRVQLDVEDVAGRALEVQELQHTGGADHPPLRGATLSGSPPCLRVAVPPDLPDGIYAGVVLDTATRAVAGTLIVAVGEHSGP
jgi:hypothetical protein